jgi:oligopeptide transport system ATP-binding protein
MSLHLKVEDLHVTFPTQGKKLNAVRGVSFEVNAGESVGIVGESGSGKSAMAQALIGLSSAEIEGKILFEGGKPQLGQNIGMVFQDPMSSLNPTMKIGAQIREGLIYHRLMSKAQAKQRSIELLKLVGIADPEIRINQYPHQFSGGQRQRILIAMAIACSPKLLIADEPTTALDSDTQQQILTLLKEMQAHFQMSLLLISHDFHVIAAICTKVLVMYAGKIVESGSVENILHSPKHPYTQLLLKSVPKLGQKKQEPLLSIAGSPPNLFQMPVGCAFKERCPFAAIACNEEPRGSVACWREICSK